MRSIDTMKKHLAQAALPLSVHQIDLLSGLLQTFLVGSSGKLDEGGYGHARANSEEESLAAGAPFF